MNVLVSVLTPVNQMSDAADNDPRRTAARAWRREEWGEGEREEGMMEQRGERR